MRRVGQRLPPFVHTPSRGTGRGLCLKENPLCQRAELTLAMIITKDIFQNLETVFGMF